MKIKILARFSGAVLFEHEAENNTVSLTLAASVKAGANLARANLARAYLDGANLDGANLDGANLSRANLARAYLAGANLDGANLAGANLAGANLAGANLAGAYLDGANLAGANLAGANLAGAYLDGANLAGAYLDGAYLDGANRLVGERPIFQVGPIGSRCAYLVAFITNKGLYIRAGCFFGDLEAFRRKVAAEHGDKTHAKEYVAAVALIEKHAELWTPEEAEAPAATEEVAA